MQAAAPSTRHRPIDRRRQQADQDVDAEMRADPHGVARAEEHQPGEEDVVSSSAAGQPELKT